ncbi:MAG TPA: hypothetical protein VK722_16915 [Candidatus Aquilonibacter sp.]|nr:hypothetical protein [Candidatus Aquilonibacter sp.]
MQVQFATLSLPVLDKVPVLVTIVHANISFRAAVTHAVTQWAPVDIADVEGDGHEDVILEGDAYENHWLEVVSVHDGVIQTIFSGLGYYL